MLRSRDERGMANYTLGGVHQAAAPKHVSASSRSAHGTVFFNCDVEKKEASCRGRSTTSVCNSFALMSSACAAGSFVLIHNALHRPHDFTQACKAPALERKTTCAQHTIKRIRHSLFAAPNHECLSAARNRCSFAPRERAKKERKKKVLGV